MRIILKDLKQTEQKIMTPDEQLQWLVRSFSTYSYSNKVSKWTGQHGALVFADLHVNSEAAQRGFVGLLTDAYSHHHKVRVAPHDLWFIFLSELAKVVNNNTDACRPLFTRSTEKITITVPTGAVDDIDPAQLIQRLRELVPVNFDSFIPRLSTWGSDPMIETAMYATFAGAVKAYYDYATYLCGIPEIEVTGTFEDWKLMTMSVVELAAMFKLVQLPDVVKYIVQVGDLFAEIGRQVGDETPDAEFWSGIYTTKNIGSGGELEISGWITKMFYEIPKVRKPENFQASYGLVPYDNLETGRSFNAVYGAFTQLRSPDGFIYSGYDKMVFEVPSRKNTKG